MRLDLRMPSAAEVPAPAARPASLALDAVTVRYGGTVALAGITLDLAEGEMVCLLGPSGSGKSTLLRVVAGVEAPTAGRIVLDGVEVAGPGRWVEPERRRVGMVFQDYALFPHLTVAQNVAFGLRRLGRGEQRRVVGAMLERLGLQRLAGSYPHTLSGGERQRVALARAMAPGPTVLLMDEPFSSLDPRLRDDVRRYTLGVLRDAGTTTLFVTHDPDEAMHVGDRIALLNHGRLVQCGSPGELYSHPATLFAAHFFGDVNVVRGACRNGAVDTPLGRFPAPRLREGEPACVCIRPEHVRLSGAGTRARVVKSTFLGGIDLLELAVAGLDTPVVLRAFGRTRLGPGDLVCLDIRDGDAFVVADGPGGAPGPTDPKGAPL